jgi:hypothetical protein
MKHPEIWASKYIPKGKIYIVPREFAEALKAAYHPAEFEALERYVLDHPKRFGVIKIDKS